MEKGVGEVARAGAGEKFGQRAGIDDAALVEEQDAVAEVFGLAHDVGREKNRAARGAFAADGLDDELAADDVEGGGGFVEDEEVGFVNEGARDVGALLLAGGEGAALLVGEGGDLEFRDELFRAAREAVLGDFVEAAKVEQHLARRQAAVELRVAGEKADAAARGERMFEYVLTVDENLPARGRKNAGEHSENGGLARAIGTEEADDLAGVDREADSVNDLGGAEGFYETVGAEDFNGGHEE